MLCQNSKRLRSKFTKETNPTSAMFSLGDDVEHAGLHANVDANQMVSPPYNVEDMDG